MAQEILQALGLRTFAPEVTSCPGCGRTTSTFFQELAEEVNRHLKAKLPEWQRAYPGVEGLKVAVMGCVVNGPGESKHAHIGISLPARGGAQGPGLRRREAPHHPQGGKDRRGVPRPGGGVRQGPLRPQGLMDPFRFHVEARAGRARVGRLSTPHGAVETPLFMPVGTQAR